MNISNSFAHRPTLSEREIEYIENNKKRLDRERERDREGGRRERQRERERERERKRGRARERETNTQTDRQNFVVWKKSFKKALEQDLV